MSSGLCRVKFPALRPGAEVTLGAPEAGGAAREEGKSVFVGHEKGSAGPGGRSLETDPSAFRSLRAGAKGRDQPRSPALGKVWPEPI